MTTGLVLIAAILVLGGVIATVGDRIGMKIGKSRLSLFNLRPRQTATLITILTGIIISAMTFGILFAVDDQLRTGVFELRSIQNDLEAARTELQEAQREQRTIQRELKTAQSEQRQAQQRLQRINRSLREAVAQQATTQRQLTSTEVQLQQIDASYRQAQTLLSSVSRQAESLRQEIRQLQSSRQQEIDQRDREIAERNRLIAEREQQLRELENQRSFLAQEVLTLEREFQGLRQGNVALLRNQPISSGVVRVVTPSAAPQAVNQILREANRFALQRIRPGALNLDEQVIRITTNQVNALIEQIQDGQEYVVRILSAGNYVIGEPCVLAGEICVQVFVAAAPNEELFVQGEVIASIPANPVTMNDEELAQQISLLIASSQFRARQAGLLDTIQIADGRSETVVEFFGRLRALTQPVELRAIASNTIYTSGPAQLELAAIANGQVVLSTMMSGQVLPITP